MSVLRVACLLSRNSVARIAFLIVLGIALSTQADSCLSTNRCLAQSNAGGSGSRRYFELATPEAKELVSLWLRVLAAPVPFARSDGKTHLMTELTLTNTGKLPLKVQGVEVLDAATMKPLLKLSGEQVMEKMASLINPADTDMVGAGQTAIVYLDVAVDGDNVPDSLIHRILADNSTRGETVTGAKIAVDKRTAVPVLGAPFRGSGWVAAEAAGARAHHRRGPFTLNGSLFLSQRYAIDFLKVVDGRLWAENDPKDLKAWYTYGQDALAALDSTVVHVHDGEPEVTPFEKNPLKLTVDNAAGNHIVFEIGPELFLVYAHLQPGSITVKVGDKIKKGDRVGLIGNSGNTDAPHLHLHVMDGPFVFQADGVPFVFERYTSVGHYESIDTLLPDPPGTAPKPMIRDARTREYRLQYPSEMSVTDWPSGR